MDQLKENRILVTIIAGLVLSGLLYLIVSSGSTSAAREALKPINQKNLDKLQKLVGETPTLAAITERKNDRYALLKSLYDAHRLYSRWGYVLHTYTVPGTKVTSSAQDFNSQLVPTLAALKDFYEKFRVIPANVKGMPNMAAGDNPFKAEIFAANAVPRAQKQFWILVEFVNTLKQAADATWQARGGGPDDKPVCVIRTISFKDPHPDPSGLFQGHPVLATLALDADLWPQFRAMLHKPDAGDLYWDWTKVERKDVVSRRVGIRFGRISGETDLANPPDRVEVVLNTDNEAAAAFLRKWPDRTVDGHQITIPKIEEEDQVQRQMLEDRAKQLYFGQLFDLLHSTLMPKRTPSSNFLEVSVSLDALDFLPDDSYSFWKPLQLTKEDVREILFQGIEKSLPADDDRTWPTCEATDEKTRNLGTRLDPQVYAIARGLFPKLASYNPYSDAPVRLGDTALERISAAVIEKLGMPPGNDMVSDQ
ncbi:MAG: hypothetical protein AB7K09_18790 [Planctomycetota bacterium]